MRQHVIAAAMLACGLSTSAHAVVEAGHWYLGASVDAATGTTTTGLTIDQTVTQDFTGFTLAFNKAAGTLALTGFNLDESGVLFVTQPGALISQALVSQGQALGSTPVTVGQDFWLGVATSHNSDPGFTWATYQNRTTFGWAHLQALSDGSLKLLDSAMAFREPGIYVGTLQAAVPEPSTYALMGLGLVGVALMARRRQAG